jgi:YVTN family beta-propeller protein
MGPDGGVGGRLEIRILGPLECLRGGVRLALGGRQQRAVLAVLLCEAGGTVSTGRLADALWGASPPPGHLTTLQTYVFHLREVLEPDRARGAPGRLLVTEPGGYRLATLTGWVDADRFEELAAQGAAARERGADDVAVRSLDQALALWRGDVLADLADYPFVAAVSGRLQEQRLAALESRFDAELRLGHHDAVLAGLDGLVAQHPLRERLHAQRILALYRSGRQSEALAAYRRLRETLQDELGIDPSPPLQALQAAVLAQDPALDWAGPAARPARTGPGPPAVATSVATPPRRPARRWSRPTIVIASVVAAVLAGGATTATLIARSAAPSLAAAAPNSLAEVRADGTIAASVPVGTNPIGLAYAGGYLWVANRSDNTVSRVDPKTHQVARPYRVGLTPEALAVTRDHVWVANAGDGTVTQISISADQVVGLVSVGHQPAAIAAGPSGVWVANSGDNTIQRIDPETAQADPAIPVGDGPDGIAVDADSVWVANGRESTLYRIHPGTGRDRSAPIPVGSGPKGIVLTGDEVWVSNQFSQSVTRVSRSTGRVRTVEVGDGPTSMAVDHGRVWVSGQFDGSLSRVDPASGQVTRFALRGAPHGLAVVAGRVWVASGAFSTPAHRGGTLLVANDRAPGTDFGIDPTTIYDPFTFTASRQLYDGLVALRYTGGAQTLVPDLAEALPEPSNGGTTYTFTVRPGIRYSTGQEVRASDFVLGVHRALVLGVRSDFYTGIKGGQHCHDHPDSCDLSQGVRADDPARTVTFTLERPDVEFLYKLAYFVVPTPPGIPVVALPVPMVGTGPYRVADYRAGQAYTLVRNPWFKPWSFVAQPDGYPDVIRWVKTDNPRASADAVSTGHADLAWLTPLENRQGATALVDGLNRRYPLQLHKELIPGVEFELLNSLVAPFNSRKARQAVNFAVDRNHLVELYGGSTVATPTCQLLPPGFPGNTPYCPYTRTPDAAGTYRGPDLAKAQSLVTASGTRGMRVEIFNVTGSLGAPFNEYFAHLLRTLGYRVTLVNKPANQATYDYLFDRRNHVQVVDGLWISDFPLASNLYYGVTACGAYVGQYCNRVLDGRAAAATELAQTRPVKALQEWAAIDHALVDDAALVPATNAVDWWYSSARVGNYQTGQVTGPQLSQLWVR